MTRRISMSPLVREQFRGTDITGIKQQLGRKREGCHGCGKPIGKNSPANLIAVVHHGSKQIWPALLHPDCGASAVYESNTVPKRSMVYFETECAMMVGERGAVPGVFMDADGGVELNRHGELRDVLLAGLTQFGFEYLDWIDREDGEYVRPIDETETTPGLTAQFQDGALLIASRDVELFRLTDLNYFPRWYRALHCGALCVSVGRDLEGMTHDSLEYAQKAASGKQLVVAVASVSVIAAPADSPCRCVYGAARTFGTCCGDPNGPEE